MWVIKFLFFVLVVRVVLFKVFVVFFILFFCWSLGCVSVCWFKIDGYDVVWSVKIFFYGFWYFIVLVVWYFCDVVWV